MKADFFIDRPVFSTVLSIIIVIVGAIGLALLPVDQYPQIVPPVVRVSASYPGADAQTVTQAVATPIEQELNGTPGMIYMESSSSNSGGFSATVTFDISVDPDLAAVDVQNRLKKAEARLPAEVVQNGISVEKQAASKLMTITLLSSDPKFDEIYLSNYATLNVLDLLRRIPGVGSISNVGSRYYAMQIWVQPDKLADLGLTVKDLQSALKDQNRESAAGVLGQAPMTGLDVTIPITAQGRLSSVSQFEDIVIRANPDGSIIRLKDVARISLEASSYSTESGINGGNAAVLNINMLPGANAMEVAGSVKKVMEEIRANFPEGISYEIPFDMTTYISESIHHVYRTLFEALLLVILVVFLSLQSWRATLIPIVAVPISLIGTFGVMLVFGFSLNMLTLLGLILAIGIVVDDAIVVVENVDAVKAYDELLKAELNIKNIEFSTLEDAAAHGLKIVHELKGNARAAGPRLGKQVQFAIKASKSGDWHVDAASGAPVVSTPSGDLALVEGEYELINRVEEENATEAAASVSAALPTGGFVILDTALDADLLAEGYARDVIRAVQDARKAADLDIADRIALVLTVPSVNVADVERFRDLIAHETLATSFAVKEGAELGVEVAKA